jgi:8-oxo-dGTP pyrophosphatase MutT (NUDIX family)
MAKEITCGIFLYDSIRKKILCCKPFINGSKDVKFWTIPKGRIDEYDKDYFAAAVRELKEETSVDLSKIDYDKHHELDFVEYKHGKKSLKPFLIISKKNLKDIELKCLSFYENEKGKFPEIGGYFWFSLDDAKDKLHYTQSQCIPEIEKILK